MALQAGRNSAASTNYKKMEGWAKPKHKTHKKDWFQRPKESSREE